jgi:hypothetical protein
MQASRTNLTDFETGTVKTIGGQKMVDFIKTNIPPKSVFLTAGTTSYLFPVALDQFMAAYPRTGALNRALQLYDNKYTLEQKIAQIGKAKIEYIALYAAPKQGKDFFDAHPEYFKKVFDNGDNTSMIYQVLPKAYEDYKTQTK